ncbi:MAG TPA: M23 family metallopeptidase, partial [Bacteroidales bacterium]|nr:M23 family metallopeptidase [Bacteroidales bacterium]
SIGDGVVVKKGYNGGAGHMVRIKHNSTYSTAYLHLSKYGKNIAVGTRVKQGDIIGYVGSSGLATGPHLDFRVYKNGSPMNPLDLKSPPAAPVHEQDLPEFILVRDSIVQKLKHIE